MRVKNDYSEEHPNLRGSRLWKQGDLLGAEESFLASIERNPESDTGYGILTGFYLEQGEFKKARATLKEWKEKTPLRFKASYHMIWTQLLSLEALHEAEGMSLRAPAKQPSVAKGLRSNHEPKLRAKRSKPEAISVERSEPKAEGVGERSEHKKQNALFHLKAAMDAGFDNDDIILKDPKLEYIRDTPEFGELIRHNFATEAGITAKLGKHEVNKR